jgi:hypothetical protein
LIIIGPQLNNQVYILTDDSKPSYTVADFSISPDYCPFTYDVVIQPLNSDGDSAVTHETNSDKTFEFFYNKDLEPLGKSQTVTVTATSTSKHGTNSDSKELVRSFEVTFKNPCIDERFVKIVHPTLPDQEYVVGSPELTWNYDAFTLDINPAAHELCGDMQFVAKFNNQPITGDVLSFIEGDRQFTCSTDDTDL